MSTDPEGAQRSPCRAKVKVLSRVPKEPGKVLVVLMIKEHGQQLHISSNGTNQFHPLVSFFNCEVCQPVTTKSHFNSLQQDGEEQEEEHNDAEAVDTANSCLGVMSLRTKERPDRAKRSSLEMDGERQRAHG